MSSTKARRGGGRAGQRAAGGGRVGILIELLRILSCSGMLLSTVCCVGDHAVEYWSLCWRRMLSTGYCFGHESTAGGRRAGGRRAGQNLNRISKDSLLQRDAVEYWVLCWKRVLLSTGCCVGDGYC